MSAVLSAAPSPRSSPILREIRRRTRVVGAFPDGQSALNLAMGHGVKHELKVHADLIL
jgi:hypothetical protein